MDVWAQAFKGGAWGSVRPWPSWIVKNRVVKRGGWAHVDWKQMPSQLELLVNHAKPRARVSVILLDWNVRESFHSLRYLNQQTVDRSLYELIWIEFYDRKPPALMDAVQAAEQAGRPLVDKLAVMNYPRDTIFHKHRMYNLGVVLAEGEICVICDSDAMFTPTFIETLIAEFDGDPRVVVHLDEVRSVCRDFYPFNNPTFEQFLASVCPNWTGTTTRGLDNSPDMLHDANYGACLAARREDIIRVGGADEHLDYLGYICGPYDLTFRLVNLGLTERWLTDEYLYHTWHPGESGINIDYHGPSDGRGMSLRALATRASGATQPGLENRAIRALREDPTLTRGEALSLLSSPSDVEWRAVARLDSERDTVRLVTKAVRGRFDVYLYQGCWFAIRTSADSFDPLKAQAGGYKPCLRAHTRSNLDKLIREEAREPRLRQVWNAAYWATLGAIRSCVAAAGYEFDRPIDPDSDDPQIVREGYGAYNLLYYRGDYFGIPQSCGVFEPEAALADANPLYIRCHRLIDLKKRIRRIQNLTPAGHALRILRSVVGLSGPSVAHPVIAGLKEPQLVLSGYRGHRIVYFRDQWYGVPHRLGAFDSELIDRGEPPEYLHATTRDALLAKIRGADPLHRAVARRLRRLAGGTPRHNPPEAGRGAPVDQHSTVRLRVEPSSLRRKAG
jgi:hypothetical protein